MANSTDGSVRSATTDLFDRYTLPKVALAIILLASLLGTLVTVRLTEGWSLLYAGVKWAYFVALGVLAGGLLWKHLFVRPADLDSGAEGYCADMYGRFDRIATAALGVLVVTSLGVLFRTTTASIHPALPGGLVVTVGALCGFQGLRLTRSRSVAAQFRSPLGLGSLLTAFGVVVLTAVIDVGMRGGDPVGVGVRILHLIAFSVWLGGAVWNIFVAVPTGQERPTTSVVRAAGQQLERFRWTVRLVIPTLFLTGLYQAIDSLGVGIEPYVASTVGLLVASKLGFIGVLVIIFKLCPMWRACSPIEGVCELEDLTTTPDVEGSEKGTTGNGANHG